MEFELAIAILNDIMSGRFPPLRGARNQVGARELTISANN